MADSIPTMQEGNAVPDEEQATDGDTSAERRYGGYQSLLQRMLMIPWIGVLFFIILIAIFLTITYGRIFLTQTNLSLVAIDYTYIAIAALGSAIVLIGGGIDLIMSPCSPRRPAYRRCLV